MSGGSPAPFAARSGTWRHTWPKQTWAFWRLGLPTSRPYAIEPSREVVTCLSQKCAKSASIRPQPGRRASTLASRAAGGTVTTACEAAL
jgi:hypothetical protein